MLLLDIVKAGDDRKEFYANVLRLFWWKTKSKGKRCEAKWSMFPHVGGDFHRCRLEEQHQPAKKIFVSLTRIV